MHIMHKWYHIWGQCYPPWFRNLCCQSWPISSPLFSLVTLNFYLQYLTASPLPIPNPGTTLNPGRAEGITMGTMPVKTCGMFGTGLMSRWFSCSGLVSRPTEVRDLCSQYCYLEREYSPVKVHSRHAFILISAQSFNSFVFSEQFQKIFTPI